MNSKKQASILICVSICLFVSPLFGAEEGALKPDRQQVKELSAAINTAIVPVPKLETDSYDWWARHKEILAIKDQIRPRIVLIGDSITHFWAGEPKANHANGANAWKETFGDLPVLNLGFGWDRTQNVLWRLDHGEFDGLSPKWVVIHIGTNNNSGTVNARENSAQEIVEAIMMICDRIQGKSPASKIIVMAVFPRGKLPTHPLRAKIAAINDLLSQRVKKQAGITYLDIGPQLIQADGTISVETMPDATHPSETGYRIWGNALVKAGIRD